VALWITADAGVLFYKSCKTKVLVKKNLPWQLSLNHLTFFLFPLSNPPHPIPKNSYKAATQPSDFSPDETAPQTHSVLPAPQ